MESVAPTTGHASGGLTYGEIVADLTGAGRSPDQVGRALESLRTGRGIPARFRGQEATISQLKNLLFNIEVQRDRRNIVFSAMTTYLLRRGDIGLEEAFSRAPGTGLHPATLQHASVGFSRGTFLSPHFVRAHSDVETARTAAASVREENQRRQIALLRRWFQAQVAGGNEPVARDIESLRQFVLAWVERNYQVVVDGGSGTAALG